MRIVLGLDLDGCLYDWHSAVYTYYQYEMNYNEDYETFWKTYINELPDEKQNYIVSLPFLYETQVPTETVMNFLEFVSINANDIYYITHRPPEMERITRRYFRRYNFPYPDNLFITGDKANVSRYLGITHFLDDHVKHVRAVSAVADSYLMAKIWNREFQEDFKTVYGLRDFQEAVFHL